MSQVVLVMDGKERRIDSELLKILIKQDLLKKYFLEMDKMEETKSSLIKALQECFGLLQIKNMPNLVYHIIGCDEEIVDMPDKEHHMCINEKLILLNILLMLNKKDHDNLEAYIEESKKNALDGSKLTDDVQRVTFERNFMKQFQYHILSAKEKYNEAGNFYDLLSACYEVLCYFESPREALDYFEKNEIKKINSCKKEDLESFVFSFVIYKEEVEKLLTPQIQLLENNYLSLYSRLGYKENC